MNSSELRERYVRLVSVPLSQLSFVEEHEYSGILLDEQWIRILLIRRDDESEYQRLELELQTCPSTTKTMRKAHAIAISRSLISSLQYILKLVQNGFQLVIIENGCVWSLSKEFQGPLDKTTLDSLLPPSEHEQ